MMRRKSYLVADVLGGSSEVALTLLAVRVLVVTRGTSVANAAFDVVRAAVETKILANS